MACALCKALLCEHTDAEWRGGDLTADEIHTIRQRAFGWEGASPGLLARVFRVSHQRITAVLRDNPGFPQELRS